MKLRRHNGKLTRHAGKLYRSASPCDCCGTPTTCIDGITWLKLEFSGLTVRTPPYSADDGTIGVYDKSGNPNTTIYVPLANCCAESDGPLCLLAYYFDGPAWTVATPPVAVFFDTAESKYYVSMASVGSGDFPGNAAIFIGLSGVVANPATDVVTITNDVTGAMMEYPIVGGSMPWTTSPAPSGCGVPNAFGAKVTPAYGGQVVITPVTSGTLFTPPTCPTIPTDPP